MMKIPWSVPRKANQNTQDLRAIMLPTEQTDINSHALYGSHIYQLES